MSKDPSDRSFASLSATSSPSKCVINSLDFLNSLSNFLKISAQDGAVCSLFQNSPKTVIIRGVFGKYLKVREI